MVDVPAGPVVPSHAGEELALEVTHELVHAAAQRPFKVPVLAAAPFAHGVRQCGAHVPTHRQHRVIAPPAEQARAHLRPAVVFASLHAPALAHVRAPVISRVIGNESAPVLRVAVVAVAAARGRASHALVVVDVARRSVAFGADAAVEVAHRPLRPGGGAADQGRVAPPCVDHLDRLRCKAKRPRAAASGAQRTHRTVAAQDITGAYVAARTRPHRNVTLLSLQRRGPPRARIRVVGPQTGRRALRRARGQARLAQLVPLGTGRQAMTGHAVPPTDVAFVHVAGAARFSSEVAHPAGGVRLLQGADDQAGQARLFALPRARRVQRALGSLGLGIADVGALLAAAVAGEAWSDVAFSAGCIVAVGPKSQRASSGAGGTFLHYRVKAKWRSLHTVGALATFVQKRPRPDLPERPNCAWCRAGWRAESGTNVMLRCGFNGRLSLQ